MDSKILLYRGKTVRYMGLQVCREDSQSAVLRTHLTVLDSTQGTLWVIAGTHMAIGTITISRTLTITSTIEMETIVVMEINKAFKTEVVVIEVVVIEVDSKTEAEEETAVVEE
jgi:NAD(P)H-hydrate repair Nnr-like enzyme with NAD(P)H-hydrate dehydratase domain